jgi:hypothetical protein
VPVGASPGAPTGGTTRSVGSEALTLWPVFLESVVQEDSVRLFELDDVVTLPVVLVDVEKAGGWPEHLGVQTSVTVNEQAGWGGPRMDCRATPTQRPQSEMA